MNRVYESIHSDINLYALYKLEREEKMYKKKKAFILAMLMIVIGIRVLPVYAAEDAIPSININVLLQQDGSAIITETWEIQGVSSGTEYYKSLDNMDDMSIESFQVWDETGIQYMTLESWNSKLSREEKADKCGVLATSKGYELCWGIGEYGNHTYTIQYKLNGFVKNYEDYAGFYHRFLGDLSSAPKSVRIKIGMADQKLNENNARIWGYGYPGEVNIETDGLLAARSLEALSKDDYINLLCRFSPELFSLTTSSDITFDQLKAKAEEKPSALPILVGLLGMGAVITVFVYAFYGWYQLSDGTKVKLRSKDIISNASIPFLSSLSAVSYFLELLRKPISYKELLCAYLIRWQKEGYISIEELVYEKRKGKEREKAIIFHNEVPVHNSIEKELYQILIQKADENQIVWSHTMEGSAKTLQESLYKWEKRVKKKGKDELLQSNQIEKIGKKEYRFTPIGFEHALQLLGLKKYLNELTKNSRSPEKELWGEYLVYASIFSIGKRVLEVMKETDPVYFNTFAGYYGFNTYSMLYFMDMTNHISNNVVWNTDGTGGSASSFGGGGFSGGGGGGSR